jgi:hypothetical protein
VALVSQSLDEITTATVDEYDSLLQKVTGRPVRVWRNNDNKLYLIFRACAAGIKVLLDAVLTLRSRFDPAQCDEVDLYSTAKMVGTEFKQGSGSLLTITVTNSSNEEDAQTFAAGAYRYTSASGMAFSFELANDLLFNPKQSRVITAISAQKGAYRVYENADIKLSRTDGAALNKFFTFSCADNTASLGYNDEDTLEFRQRILTDAERQDHIRELELAIRNLPNIFECGLVFNNTEEVQELDGVSLEPYQMLVIITGSPTGEIADRFVKGTLYHTKQIDDSSIPGGVVYHQDAHYINGQYPVYFMYHRKVDFQLEIEYQYDSGKLKDAQVEEKLNDALNVYRNVVRHVDMLTEDDVYAELRKVALPNMKVLKARIMQEDVNVPYISIPPTRMYNLTSVVFTGRDVSDEEAV